MSSQETPLISILIPTFNRKLYISECIYSALGQDFENFEIVIVDNCSDDGSWEVCKQIAGVYPKVRLFRNECNIGPVKNWIRCAELARGKYSKILFSDDCLRVDCLSEMVNELRNESIGFVFSGALIGSNRLASNATYINPSFRLTTADSYIDGVLNGNFPFSPGAVLLRTVDLRNNLSDFFLTSTPQPFDMHGAGPDVLLLFKTADNYEYVAHIPKPLVYFRSHSESFTISNKDDLVQQGYISAISYYLKFTRRERAWYRYVSCKWLRTVVCFKRIPDPPSFLRKYEGTGVPLETLRLMYEVIMQCFFRVFGKRRSYV
ncbi:glycosyltransferase family 2 protein [Synechococcus sp. UW140]|uniref:glycosyltransferase family 2 protein n=1 Tax=Synechococcus sp. UW140 TaxID=368503 RepID=UPI0031380B0C